MRSAINGKPVAHCHAEAVGFEQAVDHACKIGLPNLMKLDFQQRAERLKALAKYLGEHKEWLCVVSAHTGCHARRQLGGYAEGCWHAAGGEELGGLSSVKHDLQRAAVQGSPSMRPQ